MQTRKIWEVFALEDSKGPEHVTGWPIGVFGSLGREGREKNKMKWGQTLKSLQIQTGNR